MTRIPLSNHNVKIKIFVNIDSEPRVVEIKHGEYNFKNYSLLIINGGTVMLDGDEPIILADRAQAIDVSIPSVMDIIAEKLKNHEVYLRKIDAIPEGKEREILEGII